MEKVTTSFVFGTLAILSLIALLSLCTGSDHDGGTTGRKAKPVGKKDSVKVHQVFYFIENSASNFGYANGNTNYVDVVSELAQKQDFVSDTNITQNFNFINGIDKLKITEEGMDPSKFTFKLNPKDMKVGNFKGDDLNKMFQYALNKADSNSISIFISDAIYDVNKKKFPTKTLDTQGKETRNKFVNRLKNEGIETLVIKLKSKFNGTYYYGAKAGKIQINQERPFYIFIFGGTQIVNRYFDEKYIKNNLNGFENSARFFNPKDISVQYEGTVLKKIGNFRPSHSKSHKLIDVSSRKGIFQFTIGVDFSSILSSQSFLLNKNNYQVTNNYSIEAITPDTAGKTTNITKFKPTHFITLRTTKSPLGSLDIILKNKTPSWITKTGIKDDSNIKGNSNKTFGFNTLMQGIVAAYKFSTEQNYLAKINFNLER